VTISRTRAIRRAAQVAPESGDLTTEAEAIFGTWWADAGQLGLIGPRTDSLDGVSSDGDVAETWLAGLRGQMNEHRGRISSRVYDALVTTLRALTK
jgi:hypothetical protein